METKWKPHPGQRTAHRSRARFKVLVCGRRWGKTLFAWIQLLIAALKAPGGLFWWVAPYYKELGPISHTIKDWGPPPGFLVKRYADRKIIRMLELPNGAEIWFHSADRADTLRGEGLDGVVVDEAPQVKEERWDEELRPSLMDKKGWGIFIGTPKGKNWFHRLYLRGQDPDAWNEWESWRQSSYVNTTDNGGYLDRAEIDQIAGELPELVYRQEILAEFLEGEGTIFRNIDDRIAGALGLAEEGRRYTLGADLAKTLDFTVLTALDETGHLRGFERFRQLDWVFQKQKVAAFTKIYPGLMWLDSTGVGDPIYDDLRRAGVKLKGYKFTAESKRLLIENLSITWDEGRYTIPEEASALINELKAFTYEISRTGNVRYSAPEGLHDDCVISFGLSAWGQRSVRPPKVRHA